MNKGGCFKTASCLVAVLGLFLLGSASWAADAAKPSRKTDVEFTKCSVCHGEKTGLPSDHPSPTDPAKSDCLQCHKKKETTSLWGKIPLSHLHEMQGVTCGDCHDSSNPPQALDSDECLNCHGPFEDLKKKWKKTADSEENPHDSHYQELLSCDSCHHAHEPGENYCSQCHGWKYKTP